MIRLHRCIVLLALLLLPACDREGITVVAEVEETFGFEAGLGSWVPLTSSGDGGTASVTVTGDQAAEGTASVRLSIDDPTGEGRALISRRFEAAPDQAYDVVLEFRLGTADGLLAASPWTLRADASPTMPGSASSLPDAGHTGTESNAFVFEARTAHLTGTTDSEGTLWITLGVDQSGSGTRVYFLDEVQVAMTRR